MPNEFLLERDGDLSIYYVPSDYVNPDAKVILLGITPGLTQAVNAIESAQTALAQGCSDQEALVGVQRAAGFSGKMRGPLVEMLDAVGLQRRLGIESAAALFDAKANWLQAASALVFPVFVNGANYNGAPTMTRHPLLTKMLTSHLVPLIKTLAHAIVIPLGPKPTLALDWVAQTHGIRPAMVLRGLPHPSGANAERIAYFLGRKPRNNLSVKTGPDKLDDAKRQIIELLKA
ncbi:hypothetical protein [uncultured Thiodictyon sp.]|uniref:hypothetical protein n=1 Tax=uncultured Thiodictyon sp. TaxID=1846217 RepID=UPI0025D4710A|nr:hypothetical protein [uncultured Thiodictyon sp.]